MQYELSSRCKETVLPHAVVGACLASGKVTCINCKAIWTIYTCPSPGVVVQALRGQQLQAIMCLHVCNQELDMSTEPFGLTSTHIPAISKQVLVQGPTRADNDKNQCKLASITVLPKHASLRQRASDVEDGIYRFRAAIPLTIIYDWTSWSHEHARPSSTSSHYPSSIISHKR